MKQFTVWCEQQKLELETITAKHISQYIDELGTRGNTSNGKLGKPLSSYTIHGHARVIRRFFNWLALQDDFEDTVSPKIGKRIPMPKIKTKIIEILTKEEIQRLQAACEDNIFPLLIARNKAILAVLLDTGIRAGELCGLALDRVYITPTDAYICVLGKGSKEREVGLGMQSRELLSNYLEHYRREPANEPHVFITHKHEPLSINGLNQALYRLAERAQVPDCHAHKFRHTWAVNFLMQGGDVYLLSCLLGHCDIGVTQIYVRTLKSLQVRKLSKSVLDLM